MHSIALLGPPGTGKTEMVLKTAVRRPVLGIDIDRKMNVALSNRLSNVKDVAVWEVAESFNEDSLALRMTQLVKNEKGQRPPKGWSVFAGLVSKLDTDPIAKECGTLLIDSTTQLAQHIKAHIQNLRSKSKFEWDDWNAWKSVWSETTSMLIDWAVSNDKDLVMTFHERVSEVPGETTNKVMVTPQSGGASQRQYIGQMNVRIAAAIDGAFGLTYGTYFTDVYALSVEMNGDTPTWVCRVQPDGKRDLRCSFDVGGKTEFPPDFRVIWGEKKGGFDLAANMRRNVK